MNSIIDEHKMKQLAFELIKRKLRTSIIHLYTGISKPMLRDMYREYHQVSPSSGQLPFVSSILMKASKKEHAQISLFATQYVDYVGGEVANINIQALIAVYDLYCASYKKDFLDFTDAWVIIRDIRSHLAYFQHCFSCGVDYLMAADSYTPLSCPYCIGQQEKEHKTKQHRNKITPPSFSGYLLN